MSRKKIVKVFELGAQKKIEYDIYFLSKYVRTLILALFLNKCILSEIVYAVHL